MPRDRIRGKSRESCVASRPSGIPDPEGDLEPEKFHTPNRKTIAEVAEFTGLPETSQMKSLVMTVDEKPVLALLRGDHSLSETKFADVTGGKDIRPAHPEEIRKYFGADAGSFGPVGVTNMRIVADTALQGRRNMIAGANVDDYHLKNVTPGEDFKAEFFDLRQVAKGDTLLKPAIHSRSINPSRSGNFQARVQILGVHGPEGTQRGR